MKYDMLQKSVFFGSNQDAGQSQAFFVGPKHFSSSSEYYLDLVLKADP